MKERRVCWVVSNLDSAQFIDAIARRLDPHGVRSFYITHSRHAATFLRKAGRTTLYLHSFQPPPASYNLGIMEQRFGRPTLRNLIFPDPYLRNLQDEHATDLICRILVAIEHFVKQHKIQMMIHKPMSAALENCAYAVGKANGLPAIIQDIAPIGSKTFVYSDIDEQNIWTEHLKKLGELRGRTLTPAERKQVKEYVDSVRKKKTMRIFLGLPKIRLSVIPRFIKRLLMPYDSQYNTTWLFVRRDGLKLLRTIWGALTRMYDAPKPGEKFVFFPLHFAEDAQIVTRAPHFYDQTELVRQVALSLPAGYKLYTKEHPDERGVMPLSELRKMQGIPNVRVLTPTTNSHELIQKAEAVIVVSSSVGWEAFLYRKPVINLAPIYYALSESVLKVRDLSALPLAVKKALKNGSSLYTQDSWEKFIYSIIATVRPGSIVEFWKGMSNVSEETLSGLSAETLRKVEELIP
jgi:hypothetical protein